LDPTPTVYILRKPIELVNGDVIVIQDQAYIFDIVYSWSYSFKPNISADASCDSLKLLQELNRGHFEVHLYLLKII